MSAVMSPRDLSAVLLDADASELPEYTHEDGPPMYIEESEYIPNLDEIAAHFEEYQSVPIPVSWNLPRVVQKYYIEVFGNKTKDWLDVPFYQEVHTIPRAHRPKNLMFTYRISGVYFGDASKPYNVYVSLHKPYEEREYNAWKYNRRLDPMTGLPRADVVTDGRGKPMTYAFEHGDIDQPGAIDRLAFIGVDGEIYEWRSNIPISTINGWRWDFQRWAMFHIDPPTGRQSIVADAAAWTGRSTEEAYQTVAVRDAGLCRDMALMTFEVMKARQWEIMREQSLADPEGFKVTEAQARATSTGLLSYWQKSEADKKKKSQLPGIRGRGVGQGWAMPTVL